MSAMFRLSASMLVPLVLLGALGLPQAGALAQSQLRPCAGPNCIYLPAVARQLPVQVIDTQLRTLFKAPQITGVTATVENVSGLTLYDVKGVARVRLGDEERSIALSLESPSIPPGHRAWVSGGITTSASVGTAEVLSLAITEYRADKTPASVGLALAESVKDCASGSFRYVIRNDTPYRVGNLHPGPIPAYEAPLDISDITLSPGESRMITRPIFVYDQAYYCGSVSQSPAPPVIYPQGQVLP